MTPAARDLARLQLLVATLHRHGPMSADSLADRLGMTRKEVLSAVERLRLVHGGDDSPAGYVDIDVAPDGTVDLGRGLDQGLGRRPLPLTSSEFVALSAAIRAVARGPLAPVAHQAEAVLAKLERGLAPAARAAARRRREHVVVGPGERVSDPIWRVIDTCLARGEEVEIEYLAASTNEVTVRPVRPIEVVGRDGFWYLVAWCGLRRAERPFRLDRIISARPTGRRFGRASDLAPDAALAERVRPPLGSRVAVVRFDAGVARSARERHDPADVTDLPDGSIDVRIAYTSSVWVAGFVVSWAGHATVIAPPDLRDEVRRRLLAAFAS